MGQQTKDKPLNDKKERKREANLTAVEEAGDGDEGTRRRLGTAGAARTAQALSRGGAALSRGAAGRHLLFLSGATVPSSGSVDSAPQARRLQDWIPDRNETTAAIMQLEQERQDLKRRIKARDVQVL